MRAAPPKLKELPPTASAITNFCYKCFNHHRTQTHRIATKDCRGKIIARDICDACYRRSRNYPHDKN